MATNPIDDSLTYTRQSQSLLGFSSQNNAASVPEDESQLALFFETASFDKICVPRQWLINHLQILPSEILIECSGSLAYLRRPPQVAEGSGIIRTKKLISVIVPIYFEEDIISELVSRLTRVLSGMSKYDYELIFVNDGSTDQSLPKLLKHQQSDPRIHVLDLSRNFGHQSAITSGMEYASGDAVVVIDGDLQDPPEIILDMIKKWEEGYHVAYGVRTKREGETKFKLWTAKIFYRLLSRFSDVEIPVDAGDFRLMDRSVLSHINSLPERSRYIRGLVNWVGFRHVPVPYKRDSRYAGETKYTLRKMIRFAIDGLTSFSDKPLYLAGYLGFCFSIVSVIGIVWVFWGYFFHKDSLVTGWASLMTVAFVLGTVQLLSLSIMGLYVGRIYKEVRGRPNYIIRQVYAKPRDS